MRSHALPGLILGLSSTFCLFASIATTTSPPPKPAPRHGTASAAGTPVRVPVVVTTSASELRCLARAMWHEAKGEPLEGRIAVAEVVLARKGDSRFASTACGVVRQASQFSFVHRGSIPSVPIEHADEMTELARGVVAGTLSSRARKSLFFHATYVRPSWRTKMTQVARIGGHVFYRDKG